MRPVGDTLFARLALVIGLLALVPSWAAAQSESVEYYAVDALGSVRVVFDASGTILGRMDYAPFGEELFAGTTLPSQRFAGLFRDGEAGLDHAGARSYQSRTGRFSSVDPVYAGLFDPQRWNRYAYALNSPLVYADANGLLADSGLPSGFCGAEFSYGSCGGDGMFWNTDIGGNGFEFGGGYARAQQRGYVPGMPADVWGALEDFNQRVDDATVSAYLDGAETETVVAVVAQWPRVIQLARDAIIRLTPAAQQGLQSILRLIGHSSNVPRTGQLTQESILHILARHSSNAAASNVGRFAQGTTVQDLKAMVDVTLRNGAIRPNTLGRLGNIFELNFGRVIGTNSAGGATTSMRLVRDASGRVITAFPY